jgi:hypothetical protein
MAGVGGEGPEGYLSGEQSYQNRAYYEAWFVWWFRFGSGRGERSRLESRLSRSTESDGWLDSGGPLPTDMLGPNILIINLLSPPHPNHRSRIVEGDTSRTLITSSEHDLPPVPVPAAVAPL